MILGVGVGIRKQVERKKVGLGAWTVLFETFVTHFRNGIMSNLITLCYDICFPWYLCMSNS